LALRISRRPKTTPSLTEFTSPRSQPESRNRKCELKTRTPIQSIPTKGSEEPPSRSRKDTAVHVSLSSIQIVKERENQPRRSRDGSSADPPASPRSPGTRRSVGFRGTPHSGFLKRPPRTRRSRPKPSWRAAQTRVKPKARTRRRPPAGASPAADVRPICRPPTQTSSAVFRKNVRDSSRAPGRPGLSTGPGQCFTRFLPVLVAASPGRTQRKT